MGGAVAPVRVVFRENLFQGLRQAVMEIRCGSRNAAQSWRIEAVLEIAHGAGSDIVGNIVIERGAAMAIAALGFALEDDLAALAGLPVCFLLRQGAGSGQGF